MRLSFSLYLGDRCFEKGGGRLLTLNFLSFLAVILLPCSFPLVFFLLSLFFTTCALFSSFLFFMYCDVPSFLYYLAMLKSISSKLYKIIKINFSACLCLHSCILFIGISPSLSLPLMPFLLTANLPYCVCHLYIGCIRIM